ncbi:sulfurtransferase [Verrucomicrobium spinosum]|uniref:sulfurtransferase n=1 Tax=Verrucomicrobium spinosum TaxID=2736 RepID=UPI000ACA0F11|nr:rhodanese-like domain-containing protein [Verrucomicrobium spinosum]
MIAKKDKKGVILVDARPINEYLGQDEVWLRKGHIPGAVSFHWARLTEKDNTHKFKPFSEVKADLEAAGITKDKEIMCYCGTSREGSLLRFYLKHVAGYPNVRLYEAPGRNTSGSRTSPSPPKPTPRKPPTNKPRPRADSGLVQFRNHTPKHAFARGHAFLFCGFRFNHRDAEGTEVLGKNAFEVEAPGSPALGGGAPQKQSDRSHPHKLHKQGWSTAFTRLTLQAAHDALPNRQRQESLQSGRSSQDWKTTRNARCSIEQHDEEASSRPGGTLDSSRW